MLPMVGQVEGKRGVNETATPRLRALPDADCGFCMRSVQILTGPAFRASVDICPYQTADLGPTGLTEDECQATLHTISGDGRIAAGGAAVAHLLLASRAPWPIVGWLMLRPGPRHLAEAVYRVVVRNRHSLPGGTAACEMPRTA